MIDLTELLKKIDGDELSAQEFVTLVQAVKDNQDEVSKLDSKVGYVLKKKDGATMLHFFKDKDTASSWEKAPSEENKPIVSIELPEGGESSISYRMGIDVKDLYKIESTDKNVSIDVKITSRQYDPLTQEWTDTYESCSLAIYKQIGTGSYVLVDTIANLVTTPFASSVYSKINLKQYLEDGTQNIRLVASGYESGTTANAIIMVSIAEMELQFANNWERPYIYDSEDATSSNIGLNFKIKGNVAKSLNYEIYAPDGTKYTYGKDDSIGTATYIESSYTINIPHPQTVGIFKVKAWLNFTNTEISTTPIEENVMVSIKGDDTVLLVTNNVNRNIVNWTNEHLLDYAIYKPNEQLTKVVLTLTDADSTKSWITTNKDNISNNIKYSYDQYLSIENYDSEGQKVKLFASKLHISIDGVEMGLISFSVDNSNDFAPTVGATFVMIPSMRSNYDNDKEVIHNETSIATEEKFIPATWNNVLFDKDGWVTDENGVKSLRILKGSSVVIPYESYSNKTHIEGLTIEISQKIRNISDENSVVCTIGTQSDNGFSGLKIFPKKAIMYKAEGNVEYFQDIEWQEDKKTFIAVNIMPALDVMGKSINLVRLFVNDKINREFVFKSTDRFWNGIASDGIVIAPEASDVDIYSIRILKNKKVSSSEILNDYISTLDDVDEKLSIIEKNNILINGTISYNKAKDKYNTLVWKGKYPSKLHPEATSGDLEINIIGDKAHSGNITNMSCKGQGTSSKKYLKWNGAFGFNSDSVWTNGFGETMGKFYQLTNNSPKMTKTVGKINWASSMQSHKAGLTAMYQDLYNYIFDGSAGFEPNGITTIPGYEKTRIAVEEKPFLFFVQEDENSDPVFYGNMTWGSAKGDKKTFGYDSSHEKLKDYLMLEGTDQTPKLTLYQVPWFEDEVTYNEDEEFYQYNGQGSWDVTLGNRDSINHFINEHNFVFSYSTRIKYWNGNLVSLQKATDDQADKSYQYFIVGQPYDNFNLYRYDWIKNTWVNAGVTKDENGNPVVVNLNTQLELSVSEQEADFELVLNTFKNARIQRFREGIGAYRHVNDTLFTMQFNKMNGASDNRAKNTYPYFDPIDELIREASDDVDTVLPNNNQGQKQKPYWVEEHDFDSRPMFNGYFWAGSGNALYNTFEDAYPEELRRMMRKIMQAMSVLGQGVKGCYDKYLFSIQKYFPAVAYNECARLWYEYAKTLYDAGEYANDTDPITQSLGDLLECEEEWVKNRIVYIASYCEYADALGESIEFRQTNSSVYKITPAMKMYVYMGIGAGSAYPIGYNTSKRTESNEEVTFNIIGSGDSIQTSIRLIEYLSSVGDLSRVGVMGSVSFGSGKRLTELKLGDANASIVKFNPSTITSFPENVTSIDITNCGEQLTSIGDIENLNKLQVIKAKGTGVTEWILPKTNNLKIIQLPNCIKTLDIHNQMNIDVIDVNKQSITNLSIGNVNIDIQQFLEDWLNGINSNYNIYNASLSGFHFRDFSAENMVKLARFGSCTLEGTIDIDNNSFTQEQIAEVISVFGFQIESGKLILNYRNYISLTVTPRQFDGQYEIGHIVAKGINPEPITIEFENAPQDVYLANEHGEAGVGGYTYTADIKYDNEVTSDTPIGVTAKSSSVRSEMIECTLKRIERSISVNAEPTTIKGGIGYTDITATVTRYVRGNDIIIEYDSDHFELVTQGLINFNENTGTATRTNRYKTSGANGIGTSSYDFVAKCTIGTDVLVSDPVSVKGSRRNMLTSAFLKMKVDDTLVDAEYYWLTEKKAFEFEIYPNDVEATHNWSRITDTFDISWRFINLDECDVVEEGFGDSVVYKVVKDGMTIARMPKYPNPNDKTEYRNNVTIEHFVNETDEFRTGKDYDFRIQATMRYANTEGESILSDKDEGGKACVAHPEYYAVQSFDTTQPNYNPAVCIILEQAGLINRTTNVDDSGAGMHYDDNGNVDGMAMTIDKAATITEQNTTIQMTYATGSIFTQKTIVSPTNVDDCADKMNEYTFSRFDEFRYFTAHTMDRYGYGTFWHCSELVSIKLPKNLKRISHGWYCADAGTFGGCTKLDIPVTVFDNVEQLYEQRNHGSSGTFLNCSSLKWERLPLKLRIIDGNGGNPFGGCTGMNIHDLGNVLEKTICAIPGDWSSVPNTVQSMSVQYPKCRVLSLPNTSYVNNFVGFSSNTIEEVVFRGIEEGVRFTTFPSFENCVNLHKIGPINDSVIIPEGITTIRSNWMRNNPFVNIIFPSTLVSIPNRGISCGVNDAESNKALLEFVRIKSNNINFSDQQSVLYAGKEWKYFIINNFSSPGSMGTYTTTLKYLVINQEVPCNLSNWSNWVVSRIIVPIQSVEAYKSASGWWSTMASKITGYDFATDPAHLLTATSAEEVDESQIPTA